MRKLFWIVLALVVVGGARIPAAKADTFVYHVTYGFFDLDVTFELPTFQEFVDTTTVQGDSIFGPVTEFVLSGNSTACSLPGTSLINPGPCYQGATPGAPFG